MSSDQKPNDCKTPLTGMSGRESVFDKRLREFRNTGTFETPIRANAQFVNKKQTEFDTPSMDSKLRAKETANEEFTEIERLAFIDEHSGLLNTRTILGKLALEMRRSARYRHSFSVLMLELDGFSTMEHLNALASDMLFSTFCTTLNKNSREVDMIGRFDQSSVLIVCPETTLSEAITEAERLRHQIANVHFKKTSQAVNMTVSIGIASYPEHGNVPMELLGAALEAAQKAVALGGNNVCSAKAESSRVEKKVFTATLSTEEDFSPAKETKTQREADEKVDMSPAKESKSSEMVFPVADVSPIIT